MTTTAMPAFPSSSGRALPPPGAPSSLAGVLPRRHPFPRHALPPGAPSSLAWRDTREGEGGWRGGEEPRGARPTAMAWRRGARGEAARERERKEQNEEDKLMSVFFANVRHHGATWHATSASDARVARLGPRMNHLKDFRDPIRRFESLGT